MTALLIVVMLGMFGMALDLSRSYNRKAELQTAADSAALAAAFVLDGTKDGIDRADTEAAKIVGTASFAYKGSNRISWSSAALKFGTRADGGAAGWLPAAAAKEMASQIVFARVDTSSLDSNPGKVQNFLMPVMSSALVETNVAGVAVAGRYSLNVLPLAICANSNVPASSFPPAQPAGELVEYGFRWGVSYNLMNLNPGGKSPENFLINPVAPGGTVGTTMMNRMDVVGPFVCTGKMAIPTLRDGVTVERGFPINTLYVQLNSRFGSVTACQSSTAPADPVVKKFDLAAAATWMKDTPDGLSANALPPPNPLLTVAEQPASATKTAYGPLWVYAKAVPYAAYVAKGGVEPPGGYATYDATDWSTLYKPGLPQPKSYTNTPYQAAGNTTQYRRYRNTRVLHVPLLNCPVDASAALTTASVVGIAKFFMTVPATATALFAEFAGTDTEATLGGNVRLYQ